MLASWGDLWRARRAQKPSEGRLEASRRYVAGYLEPRSRTLAHPGGHLALSEALLEPSSATFGALTPRGAPRPDPG
eukprot:1408647-Pyramimonas_sp.AAC.1